MLLHYRVRVAMLVLVALGLAACAGSRRSGPETAEPVLKPVPGARLFEVDAAESLVTVQVYRGGALAQAGHNHVIACREVSGRAYVHEDVRKSAFELRLPVESFTVDEPGLRLEAGPEFSSEVGDGAREGTRRNMLGEAVLDSVRSPQIRIVSAAIRNGVAGFQAELRIRVRDHWSEHSVPVVLEQTDERVMARGEVTLKQTDLGLTPFTALLGAMKVQDEMRVKFTIVARAH